jgi:UDPglucose--hexose-1-phosphate uridylyltransferase
MARDDLRVRKTAVTLAGGRALMYFGAVPERPADYPDRRRLATMQVRSQARWDRLLGEWVVVASHRQDRTFQPAVAQCPLCPTSAGSMTEIPAPDYEVVVFENRFPTLGARGTDAGDGDHGNGTGRGPAAAGSTSPTGVRPGGVLDGRPAGGRCEVVCFSPRHDASFADLNPAQAAVVMAAWVDRSAELAKLPGVEQVYCFENRGDEIGVTLSHPHGQIYAYPYVTPRTDRMLQSCAGYRHGTGRNLFDDILAAEQTDSARIVLQGSHWLAFVPYAAHWPYEVHLYPRRRVPDLPALADPARAEFCELYLDLLRRFDRADAQVGHPAGPVRLVRPLSHHHLGHAGPDSGRRAGSTRRSAPRRGRPAPASGPGPARAEQLSVGRFRGLRACTRRGQGGLVRGFEHAAQPPKSVVNTGAQGSGRNTELGRDIGIGTIAQDRLDHRIPMMGPEPGQGVPQLGAQDQPVDVIEASFGRVLVGPAGRQRGPPDPGLDHVDRGVRGDAEEPVHQRRARGIEGGAGPPGPKEGFLDHILGEIGVNHDPASAGEHASVIRGVRGRHAALRAELGASVGAAGIGASCGYRTRCFGLHVPSMTPGTRQPHR